MEQCAENKNRKETQDMQLSKRLRAVADLVPGGTVPADVGTDHAYIPIALVEEGKIPRALAMDINQGPLTRAEENIKAHGLEEKIETRLSDGLEKMKKGEADTVLIAGMGGLLTVRILSSKREVLGGATLVLQPQSDLPSVRGWLAEEGYAITAEDLVLEDGKYYPMMRAQKCGEMSEAEDWNHCLEIPGKITEENTEEQSSEAGDTENQRKNVDDVSFKYEAGKEKEEQELRYGPLLLEKKHPLLAGYLDREETLYRNVLASLEGKDTEGAVTRRTEIAYELGLIAGARERLKEVK